jgi:hypothetical protein
MTEKLIALAKAIGVSDDTLKNITEETTNEQLDEIAQSFIENQKTLYKSKDVNVEEIKKGAIIEGKRKNRKAIRTELGLSAVLTNDQLDSMSDDEFAKFVKEQTQSAIGSEVAILKNQLTELGKQLELKDEEINNSVNSIKSEYENKINSIYVNSELNSLMLKYEFVVPTDEALLMLDAKLNKKGIQVKKSENEIELLDANGNKLQKLNEKGAPVGFHSLSSFVEIELDSIRKKNNGNEGQIGGNTPIKKENLTKEQQAMLAHLDNM